MAKNQILGASGEEAVSRYLESKGAIILDRNWRIKAGEIDLIAQTTENLIAFIEVKSRTSRKFGDPLEAITPEKALRIQKLALAWLVLHGLWGCEYRVDCAGVIFAHDGRYEIDYREGAL